VVGIPVRPNRYQLARFFSQVVIDGACWRWIGSRTRKGYGMAFGTSAHRATYQWFVESVVPNMHKSGIVIDHLCRVRSCVNPAHLDQVTIGENNRRAVPFRTTCKNGLHPRIGDWQNGYGKDASCYMCHRARMRKYLARKKAA
jgi:hypothetical protein